MKLITLKTDSFTLFALTSNFPQTMSSTLDNLNRDEGAYVGMIEEKKVRESIAVDESMQALIIIYDIC